MKIISARDVDERGFKLIITCYDQTSVVFIGEFGYEFKSLVCDKIIDAWKIIKKDEKIVRKADYLAAVGRRYLSNLKKDRK